MFDLIPITTSGLHSCKLSICNLLVFHWKHSCFESKLFLETREATRKTEPLRHASNLSLREQLNSRLASFYIQ